LYESPTYSNRDYNPNRDWYLPITASVPRRHPLLLLLLLVRDACMSRMRRARALAQDSGVAVHSRISWRFPRGAVPVAVAPTLPVGSNTSTNSRTVSVTRRGHRSDCEVL